MKKRKKNHIRVLLILLLLLLVFFVIAFFAPQGWGEERAFKVGKGQGVREISRNLKEAGLIRSQVLFEVYARVFGKQRQMKEGVFTLSQKMSLSWIIKQLSRPASQEVKVTVPEGFTAEEIYDLLGKGGVAKKSDLEQLRPTNFSDYAFLAGVNSFEGFLFPETHFFYEGGDPKDVVRVYLEEFQKQAMPLLTSVLKNHTLYEYLIMASIIEAEVPHELDRAVVSGILWKRLEAGVPLQVDATLNYATGGTNVSLTAEELTIDSPYNTYLYLDLPPGPIGNPGLSAIKASVSPKESPFWFFLSGSDGRTHFARDFEEHKRNKEKYLR